MRSLPVSLFTNLMANGTLLHSSYSTAYDGTHYGWNFTTRMCNVQVEKADVKGCWLCEFGHFHMVADFVILFD